ncbi:MAG: hypothetical protein L7F78_24830, partial [Syntrophales bacterium LBB04]|nr:hypothetical protein [Syntrophales bacterium LBB04]
LFSVTNILSWPGALIFPEKYRLKYYLSSVVRPEIRLLIDDLRGDGADPNKATVEFLRQHLKPNDEILCNYEDKPLMFYLKNRVRGGISCFRVTDESENVRLAVYRRSVSFSHASIYLQEFGKSHWQRYVLDAPDIAWGNFPDPRFHWKLLSTGANPLMIYERVGH